MSNPATLPLLIVAGGFVWSIACEFIMGMLCKGHKFSPSSAFWIRLAGIMGLGISLIIAIVVFFFKILN